MKALLTIILFFSFLGSANAFDVAPENIVILSEAEFNERYNGDLRWKHIVRLKIQNESFDFYGLNTKEDFALLILPDNEISAYKLYDGRFVVFNGNASQEILINE